MVWGEPGVPIGVLLAGVGRKIDGDAWHFGWMLGLYNLLPTSGFRIKPLKVKLLAGEQKAHRCPFCWFW